MDMKKNYNGLDVLKFIMALLVAQRHIIQIFFPESSRWRIVIGSWLSNLPVPVFFTIAGFFLFRKLPQDGSGTGAVRRYCMRILRLYITWCAIYLPIDFYNWYNGTRDIKAGLLTYVHRFLFDSTIPQLWYLPALFIACLLVWLLYSHGWRIWQILTLGAVLYIVGCIGDNWYFNQQLPMRLQQYLAVYIRWFLTMRNGVFYGTFYVALGLMFARTKWRPPLWVSAAGAVCFIALMYKEVLRCQNINMIFSAAPAAYFLFSAAEALPLPDSRLYPRLRGISEWIYLAHYYFFHFLVWLRPWNPVPFTSKSITVMILVPLLVFSWCMVRLSERDTIGGRFLRKLI